MARIDHLNDRVSRSRPGQEFVQVHVNDDANDHDRLGSWCPWTLDVDVEVDDFVIVGGKRGRGRRRICERGGGRPSACGLNL